MDPKDDPPAADKPRTKMNEPKPRPEKAAVPQPKATEKAAVPQPKAAKSDPAMRPFAPVPVVEPATPAHVASHAPTPKIPMKTSETRTGENKPSAAPTTPSRDMKPGKDTPASKDVTRTVPPIVSDTKPEPIAQAEPPEVLPAPEAFMEQLSFRAPISRTAEGQESQMPSASQMESTTTPENKQHTGPNGSSAEGTPILKLCPPTTGSQLLLSPLKGEPQPGTSASAWPARQLYFPTTPTKSTIKSPLKSPGSPTDRILNRANSEAKLAWENARYRHKVAWMKCDPLEKQLTAAKDKVDRAERDSANATDLLRKLNKLAELYAETKKEPPEEEVKEKASCVARKELAAQEIMKAKKEIRDCETKIEPLRKEMALSKKHTKMMEERMHETGQAKIEMESIRRALNFGTPPKPAPDWDDEEDEDLLVSIAIEAEMRSSQEEDVQPSGAIRTAEPEDKDNADDKKEEKMDEGSQNTN